MSHEKCLKNVKIPCSCIAPSLVRVSNHTLPWDNSTNVSLMNMVWCSGGIIMFKSIVLVITEAFIAAQRQSYISFERPLLWAAVDSLSLKSSYLHSSDITRCSYWCVIPGSLAIMEWCD